MLEAARAYNAELLLRTNSYTLPEELRARYETTLDALVAGKHCEFRDFGVFTTTLHKPRIGRNPKKPTQTYKVPGRRAVRFKPGKRFRDGLLGSSRA